MKSRKAKPSLSNKLILERVAHLRFDKEYMIQYHSQDAKAAESIVNELKKDSRLASFSISSARGLKRLKMRIMTTTLRNKLKNYCVTLYVGCLCCIFG